jgi:transposase
MPAKIYVVELTPEERDGLLTRIKRGEAKARQLNRARILLKADEGLSDEQIAKALHTSSATVGRVRRRFVEEGLKAALSERPRRGQKPKLSSRDEAHLIAVACSEAPDGRARWTLRLLADKAVELGLVDHISHETVRRVLKKTRLSPGSRSSGAFRR